MSKYVSDRMPNKMPNRFKENVRELVPDKKREKMPVGGGHNKKSCVSCLRFLPIITSRIKFDIAKDWLSMDPFTFVFVSYSVQ